MKIFHAAETIQGGIATVMRTLMLEQSQSDTVQGLLCLVPTEQRREINPVSTNHVRCYSRSGRNLRSLVRFFVAFTLIVLRERPTIVHLHSTFAGVLGRLSLLLVFLIHRPAVVYCPHAFAFLMPSSRLKRHVYTVLERVFAFCTDRIICVSRYEFDQARNAGLPEASMVIIYNGVEVGEPPQREFHSVNTKITELLFVGRLDRQKGFDVLLRAMALLEDEPYHLTVVGAGVHDSVAPPSRPNITYAGWLDKAALSSAFKASHVLVMPSRWEGFAIAPLEAMSHGLPVIASRCSSFPELIEEHVNGLLFPVGDCEMLARQIRSKTVWDWVAMGDKGYEICARRFTANQMVRETADVYADVLSSPLQPAAVPASGAATIPPHVAKRESPAEHLGAFEK